MQKTIKTASRRSKPPCSRRDEFLKRDRQLSLSGHPRQSKPGKLIAPSQTKRKRPRKDNAVHVSLPSDAIVKQLRLKDDQRKASPLIPGRSGRPRGDPPAKLDLNSKSSYPAPSRGRDGRKFSAPASQQGGVSSTSPETNRSGA